MKEKETSPKNTKPTIIEAIPAKISACTFKERVAISQAILAGIMILVLIVNIKNFGNAGFNIIVAIIFFYFPFWLKNICNSDVQLSMTVDLIDIYSNQATIVGCIVVIYLLLFNSNLELINSLISSIGPLSMIWRQISQISYLFSRRRPLVQKISGMILAVEGKQDNDVKQKLENLVGEIESLSQGKYTISVLQKNP